MHAAITRLKMAAHIMRCEKTPHRINNFIFHDGKNRFVCITRKSFAMALFGIRIWTVFIARIFPTNFVLHKCKKSMETTTNLFNVWQCLNKWSNVAFEKWWKRDRNRKIDTIPPKITFKKTSTFSHPIQVSVKPVFSHVFAIKRVFTHIRAHILLISIDKRRKFDECCATFHLCD